MAMSSMSESTTMADVNNRTTEPLYLIFLGPPGSGKGTQADRLYDKLGLQHVSSGDLFRENIAKGTPLGLKVKDILARGELVPDDLTIEMVMDRIHQPDTVRGVIFDGFPRTQGQAIALAQSLEKENKHIARVIYFHVADPVIVERLAARRICPQDGMLYNMKSKPPRNDAICDNDGTPLVLRDDDRPAVVQNRLRVYHEQTTPLIEYYRRQDLLTEIDAARDIEATAAELEQVTEELRHAG